MTGHSATGWVGPPPLQQASPGRSRIYCRALDMLATAWYTNGVLTDGGEKDPQNFTCRVEKFSKYQNLAL